MTVVCESAATLIVADLGLADRVAKGGTVHPILPESQLDEV